MRSSLFLLCVVGLSLTQIQFSRADVVDQTCNQTPNYDLCVNTLRSDPRCSTADVKGLATVMVDIIKDKATDTLNTINGLLGTTPDPRTKGILSQCAKLYDNAVLKADIPSATEALKKGNPKFAEQGINDAANEADSCERAFGGFSPITSVNQSFIDLSRVASAIIGLLS